MNGHGRWLEELTWDREDVLREIQVSMQEMFDDYMNDLRVEDHLIDRSTMGQDNGRLEQLSFDFLGTA